MKGVTYVTSLSFLRLFGAFRAILCMGCRPLCIPDLSSRSDPLHPLLDRLCSRLRAPKLPQVDVDLEELATRANAVAAGLVCASILEVPLLLTGK